MKIRARTIHTPDHTRPDEQVQQWYAVLTKFKREKLVHQYLEQRGVQAYLPLLQHTRRYVRKIRKVELPLIHRYLFVKIDRADYVTVLSAPECLGFVRFAKNLVPIPDAEIQILKRVVGEAEELEVHPGLFGEGDRVEVIAGRLCGLKGKLKEISGKHQFFIELEYIGHSLVMQVDPAHLRRI